MSLKTKDRHLKKDHKRISFVTKVSVRTWTEEPFTHS